MTNQIPHQLVHVGPAWAPHQPQINLPPSIDRMRPAGMK